MTVLAFGLLLGYLTGRLGGGRLRNLANVPLAGWWLLIPAILDQGFLSLVPKAARALLVVLACILLVAWCLVVRAPRGGRPGMYLVATGILSNCVAIALNGGMPVARWAIVAAGFPRNLDVSRGHLDKHIAMTAATHLRVLGDFIPVPGLRTVLSLGDIVMLAGIVLVVRSAMLITRDPAPTADTNLDETSGQPA